MQIWYVSAELTEPKSVTALACKWPEIDSDGRTIYENTHFEHIDRAWHALVELHRACVRVETSMLEEAETAVRKKKDELAKACRALKQAEDKRHVYYMPRCDQ